MQFVDTQKNIELHVHLDGAVRPDTILQIAKRRNIELEQKNVTEIIEVFEQEPPYSAEKFYKGLDIANKVISGDKQALEQICSEFIFDCARYSKLCYVEVRFAPQKLAGPNLNISEVTQTVIDALKASAKNYNLQVGVIICLLRDAPKEAMQVYEVAKKFIGKGVVGIALSGVEDETDKEKKIPDEIIKVFQLAKKDNVHRTVQVGDDGAHDAIKEAIEKLHAERIGHGYAIIKDEALMKLAEKSEVHFELCASASYMSGAIKIDPYRHPIHKIVDSNLSFSFNTDDPSMTGRWLEKEHEFCINTVCLSRASVRSSNINAVKAAFIDDEEFKEALLAHVQAPAAPPLPPPADDPAPPTPGPEEPAAAAQPESVDSTKSKPTPDEARPGENEAKAADTNSKPTVTESRPDPAADAKAPSSNESEPVDGKK